MKKNWSGLGAACAVALMSGGIAEPAFARPVPFNAPGSDDQASDLLGNLRYRNLGEIEKAGLTAAALPESPWSGDYWPIYEGVIARRYADAGFPGSTDWNQNHEYAFANLNSSSVDSLSPAEKYDLLVGDSKNTLTRAMWSIGEDYFRRYGKVETWMGICEGWSAASIIVPRPEKSVTVVAADGRTQIRFYPSDIKALASLLWSKAAGPTRLIGGRCNHQRPTMDSNHRPIDPACLDTNPATFHMVLVNGIGVEKRGFVMDANWDYEVWNQPVYAYSYKLVNPLTGKEAPNIAQARVNRDDFLADPYRQWRAPQSVSLVNVSLEVTYLAETAPSAANDDSPEMDRRMTVYYSYDLELDPKAEIVGGEWHATQHPDFLWEPVPGGVASSIGDRVLDRMNDRSRWDGKTPVPRAWMKVVPQSSASAQPLERIVSALVTFSSSGL